MSNPNPINLNALDTRYATAALVDGKITNQSVALAAQYVGYVVKLTTGLVFTVSSLSFDGWSYAGGTGTVPGYGTWFIGVDLYTKQIRTLPRDIHRGWVKLAKVVATASAITSIEYVTPQLPESRVPRTLKKILDGKSISVVVIGSSLTQSDGGNTTWPGMLFGSGSVNDYRFPASGISIKYTGVGGSPNTYQLAQTAIAARGMSGSYNDGSAVDRNNPYRGRSQLFKNVDLVVMGCLANGGEQRLENIEPIVRNLRKMGVEVLLTSDNPQGPSTDYNAMVASSLYVDGPVVARVAERYGAEFADTAAYVAEGYIRQNGLNVYASGDTIHQNSAAPSGRTSATVAGGHELWARAIRSVITVNGTQVTGELFPEGTFDSASVWTGYGSGGNTAVQNYSFSNGALVLTGTGSTTDYGIYRNAGGLQQGQVYAIKIVVTAISGSWQVGVLKDSVWGYNTGTITAPGTYAFNTPALPASSTDAGGASTYAPMLWAVGTQTNVSISIDTISINGVGAPAFTDTATGRKRADQLLPVSRIVNDMQIPGDAAIALPTEEGYYYSGNGNAGTLGAHPWGTGSFARLFSPRIASTADLLTVPTGKVASFGGTNSTALAVIRYADQNDTAVTFNVNVNGSTAKTITLPTVPFGNEWINFIYLPSEAKTTFGSNSGLGGHQNFELAVTSGTLKIAAFVAFTAEQDYLDYDEVKFRGTWTRGTSRSGADGYWSDTVGDTAYISSPARRTYFEVSSNPGSKTIDLQTDYEQSLGVDMSGQYHLRLRGGLIKSPGGRMFLKVATAATGSQSNGWSCHILGALAVYDR